MDDSVKGTDNLSTPLQPKHTAVKRNMVVLGLSPLFVRIKAMVGSPALVFVLQPLLHVAHILYRIHNLDIHIALILGILQKP